MTTLRASSLAALFVLASPVFAQWDATGLPPNFPSQLHWMDRKGSKGAHHALLRVHCSFLVGGNSITVVRHDRPDEAARWSGGRLTEELPYALTDCAFTGGGSKLYLTGIRPNGEAIVEEWGLDSEWGRVGLAVHEAPPSIGTPMIARPPEIAVPESYCPTRELSPPQRRVVYQGSEGPFAALAADTEQRYLLLLSSSPDSLLQLSLDPAVSGFRTLLTTDDVPQLGRINGMWTSNFEGEGRIVTLHSSVPHLMRAQDRYVLLKDAENDGYFEAYGDMTRAEYRTTHYDSSDGWQESWRPQLIQW